jgi:two-component system, OmpR family, sensor kinase
MYIRTRLTLWFLLILALVLAAFSLTIYQLTRDNLLGWINQDVRHQATILRATTHMCVGKVALCVPELDVYNSPDVFLQVQDPHGAVLASSGNLGKRTLPLLQDAITANQVKEVAVGHVPLFVYSQAVMINHHLQGYIIVAQSPQTIYLALHQLDHLLFLGFIIALAAAVLIVWLLVRQAMHPLEQLASTASEIAATKDHSRRLSPRKRTDEISRLAHTMNGMLQALEDSYQEVQKVNDLQRHFLIDVSHELRTPLTVMLSSLDLMRKVGAVDPEFQVSSLERIRQEAERMARMVTQLLILARSDANVTAAYEPVLVRDIVADLCSQHPTSESEPSLDCRDLEVLEGALVWGNPDYLKQLFLILLDNAFKYTPAAGSVEIVAKLNGGTVTLAIADTGIGIPADDLSRVFARFHRAENARFRSGAGLGLAIAQRVAEQHGGKIEVESAVGMGSRFIVTLPSLQ